ncbi:hypothetical protein PIROE2DRAFT_12570 [Piromyces sp. E2]|nr:hypothetical protein PIROE2DRAFT_12570 [Piromyces sp. E2]|eukprot:OUM61418.1 hypothetical protein PIROE2DRAFT_12570 [Piromyces sp. E2]
MPNIIELFHKLECVPWEYIEVESNDKDISLVKVKQEDDKTSSPPVQGCNNEKKEEDKKPMIVNAINELQKGKPKKHDSFQEKIKSIKTITQFSNSLNVNNISNSNSNIRNNNNSNNNNNNNNSNNNNSNLNLTILPLTLLSQNIPSNTLHNNNNVNNTVPFNSKISIPNSNSIELKSISKHNATSTNSVKHINTNNNLYIKYYFNGDSNTYLFMITDMKNIWYEYIDNEEILNIKKKKNAFNFETQNNLIDLIYNNIKSKEVNTSFVLLQKNDDKQFICLRLSVPYLYVTFNWDFECSLLTESSTIPMVKKENQGL